MEKVIRAKDEVYVASVQPQTNYLIFIIFAVGAFLLYYGKLNIGILIIFLSLFWYIDFKYSRLILEMRYLAKRK